MFVFFSTAPVSPVPNFRLSCKYFNTSLYFFFSVVMPFSMDVGLYFEFSTRTPRTPRSVFKATIFAEAFTVKLPPFPRFPGFFHLPHLPSQAPCLSHIFFLAPSIVFTG